MSEKIIVADPSRTVRTLVKLAFQDRADEVLEVAEPEDLEAVLADRGAKLLVVDEAWVDNSVDLGSSPAAAAAVVVLGPSTCRGIPWFEVLGLDAARVAATPKPVSRRSVREAAGLVTGASPPAAAGDLRGLVAEEVARAVGDEVRSVVWRIVPEMAERLIKEELERLLKEDEEDEP